MSGRQSLDLFDFGILLQALSNNLKVGLLAVRSGGREKLLQLDGSRLLSVYVRKPKTSVEKVLWNYRSLEKSDVRGALDQIEADPSLGPLPRFLAEREVVSATELRRAQLYQVIEEVLEVFYWKNVGFEFYAGDAANAPRDAGLVAIRESIDVDALLLECSKTIDDVAKFNEVTPSMRDVYELHLEDVGPLEDVVPEPIEREFLLLIDGLRDMREVMRDMRLNRFDALEFFYRFRTRGWLRPKNAFELRMLAENRRREFSVEKRARMLERVNELGVEGFPVTIPLAETYEEMGAFDKAALLYVKHARQCLAANDRDGAVHAASKAAQLVPSDVAMREFEIEVLATAGFDVEASVAQRRLAQLSLAQGDLTAARRGLFGCVRLTRGDADAWQLLAEVHDRMGLPRRASVCRRRAGAALRAKGDVDGAVLAYRTALANCAGAWSVRYAIADTLIDAGRGDVAVQRLSEFISWIDESATWSQPVAMAHLVRIEERLHATGGFASSAAALLGQAYARIGSTERAVAVFHESAADLARAGRHRGVVAILDALLELSPSDHAARRLLARAHALAGDGTRALAHLRRLAGFFMAANRYEEGEAIYMEMLAVDGACPDAHRGLARAVLYLGDTDRAAEHYHRVSLIYRGYGQPQEAAPYLREAVERRPNDAELLDEYCELLLTTDNRDETLRALSALVELRMSQGAHARAAIALTRILEIDSRYPGARAILQEAAKQLLRVAESSESLEPDEARRMMERARAVTN